MTHVLIDRATLEQLVAALEMPCDRWSTVQFEIAADAIKAGRAALANAEPTDSYDLAKRADNGGQP